MDVLNFGSDNRDTTVTPGDGFRYRFTDNVQIGAGGETPITDKDDTIFDYRLYFDLPVAVRAGGKCLIETAAPVAAVKDCQDRGEAVAAEIGLSLLKTRSRCFAGQTTGL